jgi:hydroxymethylpyrimidine/phosphomethylpyrimidine kinase
MEEAIAEAQEYTWQALKGAFRPGMGQYIPDRLFWARDDHTDNAHGDNSHGDTGKH